MKTKYVWIIKLVRRLPPGTIFTSWGRRQKLNGYLNINGNFRDFGSNTWIFRFKKETGGYLGDEYDWGCLSDYAECVKCKVIPEK